MGVIADDELPIIGNPDPGAFFKKYSFADAASLSALQTAVASLVTFQGETTSTLTNILQDLADLSQAIADLPSGGGDLDLSNAVLVGTQVDITTLEELLA
jgi:hypothetical protein